MANEQMHKYSCPPPPPPPPPSAKISDDELLRMGPQEILKRLRKAETDNMKLMMDHSAMMKEVNRRMQVHLLEIRGLKEVNQRLQDDNQELRDLCCFLDDDRQKGRKLAREWQRFGRYTASVMRQEVSAYQNKLRELETKQQELIKDNLELKELCLYLDEERNITRSSLCNQCGTLLHQGPRDEGDGSSSSTNNDEPCLPIPPPPPTRSSSRERLLEESIQRQRSVINEQILQYIRSLEQRIQQLEEEKRSLAQKVERVAAEGEKHDRKAYSSFNWDVRLGTLRDESISNENEFLGTTKPEAVVHAMKVLEVHEQLEKSPSGDFEFEEIGQREKDLVREMCNVVWRKLEDGPTHP